MQLRVDELVMNRVDGLCVQLNLCLSLRLELLVILSIKVGSLPGAPRNSYGRTAAKGDKALHGCDLPSSKKGQ